MYRVYQVINEGPGTVIRFVCSTGCRVRVAEQIITFAGTGYSKETMYVGYSKSQHKVVRYLGIDGTVLVTKDFDLTEYLRG